MAENPDRALERAARELAKEFLQRSAPFPKPISPPSPASQGRVVPMADTSWAIRHCS